MFKLDNDFLISLGLGGMPVDEKNKLLQTIYERLEMNVGMRLAEKMTDQQLDEFEGFIDRNDEAGALRWLETNFPNYKQVVAEELEKLKTEVQTAAPQILAAAQQTASTLRAPQPAVQPQAAPQPQYGAAPAPQQYGQPLSQPAPAQPGVNYPPAGQAQSPSPVQPNSYPPVQSPQPQPQFQPSQPQPFTPPPTPMPQPVAQPQPGQPSPSPWQQDVPAQQPPAGPGTQPFQQGAAPSHPQPPVNFPSAQ